MRKPGLIIAFFILVLCVVPLVALREPAAEPAPPAPLTAAAVAPDHDIYNPARTAMVNAQKELAESLELEREVVERIEHARQKIDASAALLASAGRLDPSMQAPIEQLQSQLTTLQNSASLCPGDTASCLGLYRQMLDDLQAMIEQY